jgi:hypothetical protein
MTLVEKVAREMIGGKHLWDGLDNEDQAVFLARAEAVLRVVADALREPTAAMERAAPARPHAHPETDATMYLSIWRAMLAASPLMEETRA